jgi:hypothetical protein
MKQAFEDVSRKCYFHLLNYCFQVEVLHEGVWYAMLIITVKGAVWQFMFELSVMDKSASFLIGNRVYVSP